MLTRLKKINQEESSETNNTNSEEIPDEAVKEAVEPNEESDSATPIKVESEDGVLEYLSYELSTDYENKPLVLIHFNYTNNAAESSSAQLQFYPQVFQNGVECEFGIFMNENEAYSNLSKELQTGTTLEVAFPYVLQDTTSPIDLEVQAMSDIITGKTYKQTINLQ